MPPRPLRAPNNVADFNSEGISTGTIERNDNIVLETSDRITKNFLIVVSKMADDRNDRDSFW
jgi:hypothetical protein